MIINSFFSRGGSAALGLSPVVTVWHVVGTTRTVVVNAQPATEATNGFYFYDFAAYNPSEDYVIQVDAGDEMAAWGRYNTGEITQGPSATIDASGVQNVVDGVWNADRMMYNNAGSTGEALNQIKADTTSVSLAILTIDQLLRTLTKYESNRTKIDVAAKTLTVYDDDKVTPIRVFDLKDGNGNASVAEVIERNPR